MNLQTIHRHWSYLMLVFHLSTHQKLSNFPQIFGSRPKSNTISELTDAISKRATPTKDASTQDDIQDKLNSETPTEVVEQSKTDTTNEPRCRWEICISIETITLFQSEQMCPHWWLDSKVLKWTSIMLRHLSVIHVCTSRI